mmetsp:Transcript_25916/g.62509  ORF Transcript_25916/g.62509 Transcript_25916/m.62509 type:complete len:438 (+) Transcript_25916:63-1376(+)
MGCESQVLNQDEGIDTVAQEFKELDMTEDEEKDFFEKEEEVEKGVGKKKKTWLQSVHKGVMKRSSSFTGFFGGAKPSPGLADEENAVVQKVMSNRSPMASENGGVRIQDPTQATLVRSVLSLMLRQMGRQLLKGQNMMNVSFPIECCQPKSILEIAAMQGGYFNKFLPRAAATNDPVERLRLVVSCFVASMTLTSGNFLKPLNPVLGETLQVDYEDGAKAYLEQTCHHPPVSSFLLEGPGAQYRYYGYTTFAIGFGMNKMLLKNRGLRVLEFADGGKIDIGFPDDRWGNVFWGEMHHETLGEWVFTDEANALRATITFNPPPKSKSSKSPPSDYFIGCIDKYDPAEPEKKGSQLCGIEGSWVGFCEFNRERSWHHTDGPIVAHGTPTDRTVLPSDSTKRGDRNALALKDYKLAQSEKTRLENVQRAERKLREGQGSG